MGGQFTLGESRLERVANAIRAATASRAKRLDVARAALAAMKYEDADEDDLIQVSNAQRIEAVSLSEAYDAMIDLAIGTQGRAALAEGEVS